MPRLIPENAVLRLVKTSDVVMIQDLHLQETDFHIPHYLHLARSLELDYHWIFSVEKEKDAHFVVDVEQLKQTLNKVLNT